MLFYKMISGISNDCQDVINLAAGMGMATSSSNTMNALTTDCCSDPGQTGVTCSNGRVTDIYWPGLGLSGYMNNTAFNRLDQLQNLQLWENGLSGQFLALPISLVHFDVGGNNFDGTLPTVPPNMVYYRVHSNSFSGPVPDLPSTVVDFWIHDTNLNGVVSLYQPVQVNMANTLISRLFITDPTNLVNTTGLDSDGFCALSSSLLLTQVEYLYGHCDLSVVTQNTQCSSLLDLATSLAMDIKYMNQININCCSLTDLKCDTSSNILSINWSGRNLSGIFQMSDLELFPQLQTFNISSNSVSGNLVLSSNNLNVLDLSYNNVTGNLTLMNLPVIETLNIAHNQFYGQLVNFPSTLKTMNGANNNITGPFPNLNAIVTFDLSANNFRSQLSPLSDALTAFKCSQCGLYGPVRYLPKFLVSFNVSKNKLSGSLTIPALVSVIDISYNSFNGSLFLYDPIIVDVEYNQLSKVQFYSTSSLQECDLRNNPLSPSVYPSLCFLESPVGSITTHVTQSVAATLGIKDISMNQQDVVRSDWQAFARLAISLLFIYQVIITNWGRIRKCTTKKEKGANSNIITT